MSNLMINDLSLDKTMDRDVLAAITGGAFYFDEADALFGKRGEAMDSRDRYSTVESVLVFWMQPPIPASLMRM